MLVRIGNGAGFLGDDPTAPRRLVEGAELDYLTLEYLAELTLSILARQRQKDPAAGFATDFIEVLESLVPALNAQQRLRIVTNGGGMNPRSCARAAAEVLVAAGRADEPIGVVTGDDLLDNISPLQQCGCKLENMETGQPLSELAEQIVSANAYLGARPISEALAAGARLVITGRVADASLTVGPAVHELGWKWDDISALAAASVAGHLIECGAQVTGGLYRHYEDLDLAHVGYPIAELSDDRSMVITKPKGTGGCVTRETVVEQLVYEIGDPAHYMTPDVDVDFTSLEVEDLGNDRVAVRSASGRPASNSYKVSLAYHAGYMASGQLLVYGVDCVAKAKRCAQMVFERVEQAGFRLDETSVECLGAGDATGIHPPPKELRETVLRLAVRARQREAVEQFTRQIAPLITSGPPGLAGYAAARSPVRPVFAYWPALIPKQFATPSVEVRPAREWLASP